jgi:hypothetical protein
MKSFSRISGIMLSLALLGALILGVTHVQALEDWVRLRNYTPPAAVSTLATEDAMTSLGTHIFYVNHPNIQANAATFRQACATAEQTIVLGCYHSNQNGIEIFDVKDGRLKGVEEVTAAHEMLHAAYDRLSSKQKQSVDNMLIDFYQSGLQDQRVKDTIDLYKKTEPNDVVNEMHSVFGTEVAALPAPLESYYSKYFSNRSVVTAFAGNYEGEFTSRTTQINADDGQLAIMKAQIKADEQSLSSQVAGLQADRARIENSGSESDINAYNARVSAYNAGVHKLQSEIAAYNALVEQRNAIAADLASLQGALDTRLTTQPKQ